MSWKGHSGFNPFPPEDIFDPEAIPESQMFESRKVCLALPFYKTTDPRTAFSLMALVDRKRTAVMLDFGDAFIAHSRNKLADNFLKSPMEWLLMVDDDMILPFGNAQIFRSFTGFNFPDRFSGLNTIDRLLSHGKSLVGGLYFGRWPHGKPVYAEGSESKQEEEFVRRGPHDICKPTRWVGTGCLLIHRTVFTAIEAKFPHLARKSDGKGGNWFTSSEHDLNEGVTAALKLIDSGASMAEVEQVLRGAQLRSRRFSGLGVGEDVVFCHRAAQAGHQPHVDLGLICGHVGSKCYGPDKTP